MNREHQKLTFWDNQRVGLNLSPTEQQLNCRAFSGKESTNWRRHTARFMMLYYLWNNEWMCYLHYALFHVCPRVFSKRRVASRNVYLFVIANHNCFIPRSALVPFCNQLREHVFAFTENPLIDSSESFVSCALCFANYYCIRIIFLFSLYLSEQKSSAYAHIT